MAFVRPHSLDSVPDPYQVLGVPSIASSEEIKRAFRGLAQRFHPDMNPDNKTPLQQFQLINAAYEILSNKKKRQLLDTHIQNLKRQSILDQQEEEEDNEYQVPLAPSFRGKNITYAIHIPFLKAVLGGPHAITATDNNEHIHFMVPPGTEDGYEMTLKGKGQPSSKKTGIPGNAHIVILVEAHPLFHKENYDIVADLPLSVDEALLGKKISVPSLRTPLRIIVPARSNSDDIIRITGEGVPAYNGHAGGDLLYRIKIMLPQSDHAPLVQAIENWAEHHPSYSVRNHLFA